MVFDVTSKSEDLGRQFSPFLLGPVDLYGGYTARIFENAWQYSKVYAEHADDLGNPTQKYWDWAMQGWNSNRAVRYPFGKGAKPLYSLWNGHKLSYIEARRKIYIPLYKSLVSSNPLLDIWVEFLQQDTGNTLVLLDFDAYDHKALGMSLEEVFDSEKRKAGHGFVLAHILDQRLWGID